VILTIYDCLGRELQKPVDERLPAGNYEVILNASDLSEGVYFYKILTKSENGATASEVRKMVLRK
jgi:hypothetical protein